MATTSVAMAPEIKIAKGRHRQFLAISSGEIQSVNELRVAPVGESPDKAYDTEVGPQAACASRQIAHFLLKFLMAKSPRHVRHRFSIAKMNTRQKTA